MSWVRTTLAVGLVVLTSLVAASTSVAQAPGSPGLGDPYFPLAGNGGYEVDHYDLNLSVRPSVNRLRAVATISATSTQALSAFDLDLEGLRVTAVTVDGARATFAQRGPELSVTPSAPIRSGAPFTVAVAYGGRPRPVDGTGWLRMRDGTWVASEPSGALSWFPCNDHPSDKATFSFSVTVPKRYHVIANGLLDSVQRHGRAATFAWHEPQPMATYLATVMTGRFRLRSSVVNGLPSWSAVAGQKNRHVGRTMRKLPRILSFESAYFGPYPFSSTGSIVTPGPFNGALETQTRPVYFGAPFSWVVAHEQAHQWFGDAVTIERWSDIWLNEGFATFAQWLWEAKGNDGAMRFIFRGLYRSSKKFRRGFGFRGLWDPVLSPRPSKLFGAAVYFRGAMTLEALREMVGDTTLFSILRDWIQQHKYGNATTEEFIALAEADSGRSLSHFFDIWLRQPGRPTSWT